MPCRKQVDGPLEASVARSGSVGYRKPQVEGRVSGEVSIAQAQQDSSLSMGQLQLFQKPRRHNKVCGNYQPLLPRLRLGCGRSVLCLATTERAVLLLARFLPQSWSGASRFGSSLSSAHCIGSCLFYN